MTSHLLDLAGRSALLAFEPMLNAVTHPNLRNVFLCLSDLLLSLLSPLNRLIGLVEAVNTGGQEHYGYQYRNYHPFHCALLLPRFGSRFCPWVSAELHSAFHVISAVASALAHPMSQEPATPEISAIR
ncbi:MAG: hypothetical protein US94_C0001G0062 [Berkelbacteria bacterium GW2011_GWB1_38_5]|uniref:Uncharacterized protein n=2 Tax=Candidatus Berkelbacteria TaxID=1618330 RepID=A0A0G0LG33_9BACT|nr:MAG: hypothetical protein US94_C0001G0062 [Berkelbacteria bacterium GW2011_GWB1_38_5]KKQ90833.1 MAG: hypothetical protein UT15_C0003G0008 [Berkelbacteria bacterium GW2011_GWA1_39_10]